MIDLYNSNSDQAAIKKFKHPISDVASRWLITLSDEKDPQKVEHALCERIKELNCLYGIAKLAERNPESIEEIFDDLVNLLPPSWQYPDIACARIIYKENIYKSSSFKISQWRQVAQILIYGERVGEVAVFYKEKCPPAFEGPFLKEERTLINAIAERISTLAMRLSAEKEVYETNRKLSLEHQMLLETNAALKTVLARIEDEKKEIHKNIQINVEKVLLPILHALSLEIPKSQRKYIELIRNNLEELTSPFIKNLSNKFHALTPAEVSICNMIRNGICTKDIARLKNISSATVNHHRENIRKKLGIVNQKINLVTYLQNTMFDTEEPTKYPTVHD